MENNKINVKLKKDFTKTPLDKLYEENALASKNIMFKHCLKLEMTKLILSTFSYDIEPIEILNLVENLVKIELSDIKLENIDDAKNVLQYIISSIIERVILQYNLDKNRIIKRDEVIINSVNKILDPLY